MSQRLSLLLKLSQRSFSINTASTSKINTSHLDLSFSNQLISTSQPRIDRYCNTFLSELSHDLNNLKSLKTKIDKCRRDLEYCFQDHAEISFVPIGSAANGLLHNGSDLDLVLIPSSTSENWKKFNTRFEKSAQFRFGYMQTIRNLISSKKIGRCDTPYYNAKTPIIRLKSDRKLQIDIQFGSTSPIRSTIFIRTCVEFDERVGLLIHWLYKKFEESRILKSSDRLFSRYHVNMLVIHFLQALPTPVLPDIIQLAPWCSPSHDQLKLIRMIRQKNLYVPMETANETSVGGLAIQLIDYFSQFDFGKRAIDTRGRNLRRSLRDPNFFELRDVYFPEFTCRVYEAPRLFHEFFGKLKDQAARERYDHLFCYHFL